VGYANKTGMVVLRKLARTKIKNVKSIAQTNENRSAGTGNYSDHVSSALGKVGRDSGKKQTRMKGEGQKSPLAENL